MDGAERVRTAVVAAMRAAAGDDAPAVLRDVAIGPGGARADLAIVADELIGVVVLGVDGARQGLDERLADYARRFDRVAVAAPQGVAERVRLADASPAAVWAVDERSGMSELRPGRETRAGVGGWFGLLTIDERRRVLRAVIGRNPAWTPRAASIPVDAIRREIADALAARG